MNDLVLDLVASMPRDLEVFITWLSLAGFISATCNPSVSPGDDRVNKISYPNFTLSSCSAAVIPVDGALLTHAVERLPMPEAKDVIQGFHLANLRDLVSLGAAHLAWPTVCRQYKARPVVTLCALQCYMYRH